MTYAMMTSRSKTTTKRDIEYLTTSLRRELNDNERRLISSLDALFLLDFLESRALESLLKIHSQVSETHGKLIQEVTSHKKSSYFPGNSVGLVQEVASGLNDEWVSEAQILNNLLNNPHIQNCLRICDTIAKNDYYPGDRHEYYNVQRPSTRQSTSTRNATQAGCSSRMGFDNPIYQSIDSHLPLRSCHHHYDVLDGESFEYDKDEEECSGRISRITPRSGATRPDAIDEIDPNSYTVKVIQIVKGNEPLGITVKLLQNSSEAVVVSRILYGGSAYRSGLISVGDIIFEVNGISLKGKSHREVVRLLERESQHESISFKLLVADESLYFQWTRHRSNNNISSKSELKESGIFVRAHFDYNPCLDKSHPCPEGGLLFKKGDVLEIVSQEDENWWQARHEDDIEYTCRAGVIPSTKLHEKRLAAERDIKRQEYLKKPVEIIPGIKSPIKKQNWSHRVKKIMYTVHATEEFEDNDLATYEEVIHLFPSPGFCRPIVIFGSLLIGKNKLIRRLIHMDNHEYQVPVAHTTRVPRHAELDGAEYFFSDRQWFLQEAQAGNFVEYEEYKGNLYGIHRESIRSVIASGSVCILSLNQSGLKAVRNSLFKPFVVFLKPNAASLSFSCCSNTSSPCRASSANRGNLLESSTPNKSRVSNEYTDQMCDQHNQQNDLKQQNQSLSSVEVSKSKMMVTLKVKRNLIKNLSDQQKYDLLYESSRMEYLYGHYFDVVLMISQEDTQETVVSQLVQMIRAVQLVPQWAPASWL